MKKATRSILSAAVAVSLAATACPVSLKDNIIYID